MMKGSGAVFLVIVILFLSVASGLIFARYIGAVRQNEQLSEKLSLALDELGKIRAQIHSVSGGEPFPQPNWKRLSTKTRPEPRSWLTENLLSRQDLIPWKGVHGGTMKIFDPSLVWFIGPTWCIAWVEDGHIGGYILLKFDAGAEDAQWRLLDSAISD